MEEMKVLRTVAADNGEDVHELDIIRKADGTYWLHDTTADPSADSLEQLQDDSDTAVADVLGDEWEIIANY